MLVRFVGVHDPGVVGVPRPVLLQIREEPKAGITDRDVHEPTTEGDSLRRGAAFRGGEKGEVPATVSTPDHANGAFAVHRPVPDPVHLPLHPGEYLTGPGGEVVGEDRLGEDV